MNELKIEDLSCKRGESKVLNNINITIDIDFVINIITSINVYMKNNNKDNFDINTIKENLEKLL